MQTLCKVTLTSMMQTKPYESINLQKKNILTNLS